MGPTSPPQRLLTTVFALLATTVFAQEAGALVPPRATLSLTGGGAARALTLQPGASDNPVGKPLTVTGVSAALLNLRADFFFLPWLGVDVDGTVDTFSSVVGEERLDPISHLRLDARVMASARYVFPRFVALGGSVGYAFSNAPYRTYSPSFTPAGGAVPSHGVAARLFASLWVDRFEATLDVTFARGLGGGTTLLEPRLLAGVRLFESDSLSVALVAQYSAVIDGNAVYSGQYHRFSGGVRVSLGSSGAKRDEPPPPPAQPTTLRVVVQPPGATVSLDGLTEQPVDEAGRVFTVTAGAHALVVKALGFRTLTQQVEEPESQATLVQVTLQPLTGPGSLKGVVASAQSKEPISGATVTAGERSTVTDASGQFAFAAVGPGPVKVRVEAQGFTPAEEVAQVPPEQASTLDVSLEKLGKGSPATVRGLVRSRSGEPLKASVSIKGVAKKVQVTAEGRFVVTIPGGDYLFVISAPGYVSQTKKVTLADGDQAIFHTELQKAGK